MIHPYSCDRLHGQHFESRPSVACSGSNILWMLFRGGIALVVIQAVVGRIAEGVTEKQRFVEHDDFRHAAVHRNSGIGAAETEESVTLGRILGSARDGTVRASYRITPLWTQ